MRIFVTGANGFIGRRLIKKLIKDHQVTVLTREKLHPELSKLNFEKIVIGDITKPDTYKRFLKNQEIIIHLAAIRDNWGNEKEFIKVNSDSINNFFIKNSRLKHIILTSSVYVHGSQNKTINEDSPINDRDIYSKSKILAEKIIQNQALKKPFYTIIRPAIVYGPGDNKNGMIVRLIQMIKDNRFMFLGNGENRLHLVYVDDLVTSYIKAIEKGPENQTYIVASKEAIKIKNMIKLIERNLKIKNRRYFHLPKSLMFYLAFLVEYLSKGFNTKPLLMRTQIETLGNNWRYDIRKASIGLKYKPSTNYKEGIAKTITWLLSSDLL